MDKIIDVTKKIKFSTGKMHLIGVMKLNQRAAHILYLETLTSAIYVIYLTQTYKIIFEHQERGINVFSKGYCHWI